MKGPSINPVVHFLVPGRLAARSGGSLYDAHMVAALRQSGWDVRVHELAGSFPVPDQRSLAATTEALAVAGDDLAVIDGLCLSAVDGVAATPGAGWVALMHHPAALETGLAATVQQALAAAERRALADCRHVVTTSQLTARQMTGGYDVAADKVTAIVPGVGAAPLTAGRSQGVARLLCVGAVIPRKGHDVLVAALARLQDVAWRLDCYGNLRDRATVGMVRGAVRRHDLGKRVRLWGEVGQEVLARAYATADLFVLASHYEGYGMAFSEAVARGLPVVGCDGGAVGEAVDGAGVLVAPGDAESLAVALQSVLTNGALRGDLVRRARQARARQRGWDVAGARLAAVLRDVG